MTCGANDRSLSSALSANRKAPHLERRHNDFHEASQEEQAPVVLTVKGKAEAIVQDAEACQRLLDIAARADVYEAIRQGLEDAASGITIPASKVFEELRAKHGIPG